jgi:hypothetical protein
MVEDSQFLRLLSCARTVPAMNRRSPNLANVIHDEQKGRMDVVDSAGVITGPGARERLPTPPRAYMRDRAKLMVIADRMGSARAVGTVVSRRVASWAPSHVFLDFTCPFAIGERQTGDSTVAPLRSRFSSRRYSMEEGRGRHGPDTIGR